MVSASPELGCQSNAATNACARCRLLTKHTLDTGLFNSTAAQNEELKSQNQHLSRVRGPLHGLQRAIAA